jgi:ParB-like chromosome segregation protein Spo0J
MTPYKNNARTHSKKQIKQIASSIKRFGFNNPVLVDDAAWPTKTQLTHDKL